MRKRTLLATGLILFGLLFTMASVNAAERSIADGTGDVTAIDENENMTIAQSNQYINVDDIDIVAATCNDNGAAVTVSLRVQGIIQDRGNINDIFMEGYDENTDFTNMSFDTIGYSVNVSTNSTVYTATYVNHQAKLARDNSDTTTNISSFSKNGNTVTMTFTLDSPLETVQGFGAQTMFIKINFSEYMEGTGKGMYMYSDAAPNEPLYIMEAGTTQNLASIGTTVDFSCSLLPSTGQPPFTYNWDFGDGQTDSTPATTDITSTTTHVYNKQGDYTYNVTVTDSSGYKQYVEDAIKITGNSGGSIFGSGNMVFMFLAIIVIIAIAGVAIVIYLIRR
jgi:hypothetical protein